MESPRHDLSNSGMSGYGSFNHSFTHLTGGCRCAATLGEIVDNASISWHPRLRSKTHDEASDPGGSKEEQEKEAVQIPYTQPEGIQKAIRETRAKSKGAPVKDAVATGVLIDLVSDSQPTATNRTRTAVERKPTWKASEATQEKDDDACLAALAEMKKTINQQAELIRTMYEEIKALRELQELLPMIKDLQKEVVDLKATQARHHEESRKAVSKQTDILCTEKAKAQDTIKKAQPSYAAVTSIPPVSL